MGIFRRRKVETLNEQAANRMLKTLADPSRLARTYALCIPGWLTHRFNVHVAPTRGLAPISAPEQNMRTFEEPMSA